jgi:ubiquinol-cytochrome c reductase cytochrome c subunit
LVITPFAAAQDSTDSSESTTTTAPDPELVAEGKQLYEISCSSCHGPDGAGRDESDGGARGPSLQDAGEAAAYFYLSTGRMPMANSEEEPVRKEPAFTPPQIEALVAYVTSLGEGPALPVVDPSAGDLALGGEIYRANCQACHGAGGSGGALSYGRSAPKLGAATPEQVAAAVRVGPGQMPVFGPDIIGEDDLDDLVAYVEYLDNPDDPGGLPIGGTGPIPEGFVAWLIGMVAFLGLVFWIGTRSPIVRKRATTAEGDDEP